LTPEYTNLGRDEVSMASMRGLARVSRFMQDSNLIEGIDQEPTTQQLRTALLFLELQVVQVADILNLATALEPGARLRESVGDDVKIPGAGGPYQQPPAGGPEIRTMLEHVLRGPPTPLDHPAAAAAHTQHLAYERLHPLTDCNGRTGRLLWLHRRGGIATLGERSFLHEFYYDALEFREWR